MEDPTSVIGSPPSSPGLSPVFLSDAIEELVRFTLSSFLAGDEEFSDLGFSKDYCSRLLQDDPVTVHPHLNDVGSGNRGVPQYPLYTRVAKALQRWIDSAQFFGRSAKSRVRVPMEESLKMKVDECNDVVQEMILDLQEMYRCVDFELHVQEPFFSQLRADLPYKLTRMRLLVAGLKKVEGRCAVGDYKEIIPGASLLFNKCLLLNVERVTQYSSFSQMLEAETLAKVLPGILTIEEGVQIYRNFYTEEKEKSNGVLAISISKAASQPYICMKNLLAGLSMRDLLGMSQTVGTVSDELPPPRSILLSSSMKPHQSNIKGCSLTDAARALAKHVNRSSDGWWGDFRGSDSNKNQLALEVINHLLADCCWMNVHLIQPYGCVFEIRVHEGYGARWSKDGLKFIGFLEPYTKEGFSKGWKH